jgi:hypothetical protein
MVEVTRERLRKMSRLGGDRKDDADIGILKIKDVTHPSSHIIG